MHDTQPLGAAAAPLLALRRGSPGPVALPKSCLSRRLALLTLGLTQNPLPLPLPLP